MSLLYLVGFILLLFFIILGLYAYSLELFPYEKEESLARHRDPANKRRKRREKAEPLMLERD